MAQHDMIIPRLSALLILHTILIISTAVYPSSGMPQAASVPSVTPIYYVPPPPPTSVQYASTSSYDFWWPYPSLMESSVAVAPTEPITDPLLIGSTSTPIPLFAKPAVNMTSNNVTQPASVSPSSAAETTSLNSSAASPSSTTSISYIQITASSSPDPNANAVHNGGGKPFKITYLAPIFAILGLILGLTLSGMIYARCAKRRDHFRATFSRDIGEDENAVHGMEDQSDPLYPFPHSRSLQVELGNENPGRRYNNLGVAHRYEESNSCNYLAIPGKVDATPIIASPSRDTALRSLAHTLQQLIPGASPSSALRRINDDRAPLVPTDVPPAPRTHGESAPAKWLSQETGTEKGNLGVRYLSRVRASPAGPGALPDGFQEVSLQGEDNPNGDGEDIEDEELIYGRQSHGSIRRRIAEKLRIGSRRPGRGGKASGGRELDDAAVRRVSGTQLHPSGIETVYLRGSRARDQTRDEGAYRNVDVVVDAFTFPPQPTHTSPSTSTPTYEPGPSTVLRALNPDHDSETSSSISPTDGASDLRAPVLDVRPCVLPGLRPKEATVDADGGTTYHIKRTRLIPSSRIISSNTGPISTPPARYRARGTTSLPQKPDDPLDNRNRQPQREPQSLHPILDAPQTVLSPPAHPDLFFADPVLGQYLDDSSSKPPMSSSAKRRPNISERRRLGVPSPSYTPRKFKVHDRPLQEGDEIPSPGAGSQSSADPPTNTSSFIPPARTRAMQGRVDAIVRSSWGARDVQQEPTRPGRSFHNHDGRETPSLTTARGSGIEDRRQILLAREQTGAFN